MLQKDIIFYQLVASCQVIGLKGSIQTSQPINKATGYSPMGSDGNALELKKSLTYTIKHGKKIKLMPSYKFYPY